MIGYGMKYCVIVLVMISVCVLGCKETPPPTSMDISKDGVKVKVTYGAGDQYNVKGALDAYLPLPFNLATMTTPGQDTLEFLILSDRIYKGQDLHVLPIGAMRLMDEGAKRDLYMCIPEEAKRQTFGSNMFADFATEHAAVKWIIENYFVNYKGFSKVQLISWEDEQYALRKIEAASKQSEG